MSEHRNGTADGQPRTEADAEKALTGRPLTLDYRPNWVAALSMTEDSGRWPYAVMLRDIERMLGHPDVQLPYDHYRDGISSVKLTVKCRNDREEQFAFQQLRRLWEHDLDRAMLSYDYGWAGLEVVYREKGALLHYDGLEPVHPLDAWARVRGGKYAGFQVRGNLRLGAQTSSKRRGGDEQCMDLWGPGRWPAKGLWIVHNRRWDRFYGRSQLFGAWRPWQRLANRDGAEEVTDGGFYRFAYKGPVIRYPASDFKRKGGSLNDVDYDAARNAAREMAEQAKAGFSVALPNSRDEKGNYKWEMEWPDSTMNVEPLLGYVDHLQKAIARGIGVPPELLEASEVGSGWSGRMIPLIVFQTTMRKNARNIVRAFVRQVVEPLLVWNFGPGAFCEADAEIVMPPGLAPEQPGQGQPGAAPPDAAGAPAPGAGGAGGGGVDALAQMLGGGAGGGGAGGRTPYQGPRGGKGWKDASGKVYYGELSTVPDGFDLSTAVECDGWELATINSADWQPYTGKRGKRAGMAGWKSTVTGRVSWGPHRPGTYSYHKQRTERAMASRAAPKGQRSTPDEAHHAVRALLGEGATPTPEKISEAVEVLLALPMADLKALKARVGAIGGGGKSGLAARIAARAGLVEPPPLPEKVKEEAAPPTEEVSAKEEAKGKEPWEMSRREYGEYLLEKIKDHLVSGKRVVLPATPTKRATAIDDPAFFRVGPSGDLEHKHGKGGWTSHPHVNDYLAKGVGAMTSFDAAMKRAETGHVLEKEPGYVSPFNHVGAEDEGPDAPEASKEVSAPEADTPPPLPEPNFTGTLTDALGREYHFVDGKRVAGPPEAEDGLESAGTGGDARRVRRKQRLGAVPGEAPESELPGAGGGAGADERPEAVPDRADGGGDGAGGPAGGAGSAAARGQGAGDGGAAASPGGSAGDVGDGGGAAARPGGGNAAVERALAGPATPEKPTDLSAGNWRYPDTGDERTFARGGLKQKFADNLAAIKTIRAIAAEGRSTATPEEQAAISKFVGWGQFPALFNNYWDRDWMQERTALQAILSPEEWDAARKSTLNAHYTHPDVVKAHWEMAKRLGFDGGRFLETSAGIGYYLGMMPPDMAARTHASAVELDPTTGKMLSLLYPAANVAVQGFQDFQAPDNFYDLIASNVPFGDYRVHDPRYNKHQANIHDYFFLKSADKVRPGGLVMHVTSTGTMDKADPKMRALLAEKGLELVSAIRFPAGAHKENAGTDVVTDMLVFRKKHAHEGAEDLTVTPDEAQPEKAGFTGMTTDSLGRVYHWKDGKRVPGPRWDDVVMVPDPAGGEPIPVNRYFADNPEQVLGTLDRTGTMYQGKSVNVSRTDDYAERLKAAIGRIPEGVLRKAAAPAERFAPSVQPAPGDVKEGGYTSRDGKLLVRDGGALVEVEASAADRKRILAHLEVRDALRAVINAQLEGKDAGDARKRLGEVYDAFVKAHGALNLPANKKAFRADPDSPVLLALEKYDPKTKKATKADIFARDTIRPATKAEKAATAHEALGISLHETGRVDIDRMAELLGRDPETVGRALVAGGVAYEDPSSGWAPADQYLSGNVRRKLLLAQAAAQADPKYLPNVEALKAVQPEDIDHADIDVKLGASWVPPSDVAAFAAHILQGRPEALRIDYSAAAGQWFANFDKRHGRWLESGQQATQVWATDRKNFKEILEAALNGTSLTVWDPPDSPGAKATVNRQATDDANAKVEEMKEAFKGWVWEDDARRERLHRFYNDNFNNVRNLRYDGSHQTFPGMSAGITLRPHQRDFVWQVVTTGKGLAAHEVGTGKTLSMIASAMELRRLGLAKKPAIACLKANIEQITNETLHAYPGARIISTADMFDAASRKATIARIATGDYDLVLLTHDHLDMLPMKPEVSARYIREELAELEAAIVASREADDSKNNRVVKALEKSKLKLEQRLKEALDGAKDDAVTFEETGIDHLFVDEAHKYKSLPVYTRRQGLKGVPTSRSDRATAMEMRTRWLMENNGGRGVVFATGTPVANTMAELYTMQKYLQRDELKERGVDSFDAWANAFGDIQTKMEFTVSGEYKPVSRFAKFVNIPELMQMARQMMDVQRADGMTKEDGSPVIVRPKRKDDVIVAPKSEAMARLMADLQDRAKSLKGRAEKGSDNMLAICTDGRKGALDMRLLDAGAEDDPESKTNQAVRKVLELHRASPGKAQLIFSDVGVNPTDQGFHLYGDVIQKLVDGGIPREKIADFSQLDGAKKEAAMEAMRKGEILIGIGSTDKLGTGVNVQQKLTALHHLDVPWMPASVEQRDGRGWRQGNENKEVGIYRYVSEGSLDQTFWQIIGNKSRFIRQVITNGDQTARVARDDDAEELSPEQLMAAASGDPRVLEKVNLDEDVKQLTAAQRRHDREQQKFRDTVAASERNLPHFERAAKAVRADVDVLAANPDFSLSIRGQKYTDRKEADEAFLQWQKDHADEVARSGSFPSKLGTFRGLDLWLSKGSFALKGPGGELHPTGDSLRSIEAIARNLAMRADGADKAHAEAKAGIEAVRANLGKVFAKAQELADKQARLKELEAVLAGKTPEEIKAAMAPPPAPPPSPAPASSMPEAPRPSAPAQPVVAAPALAPKPPAPAARPARISYTSGDGLKYDLDPDDDTVVVSGKTFAAKDELRRAGFRWNGTDRVWEGDMRTVAKLRYGKGISERLQKLVDEAMAGD